MLYQPAQARHMWDTWAYTADGVHHVYYLYMEDAGSPGDGVGHARSTDGVHWEETGPVIVKLPDAEWLGSGAVWRAGNRYVMNFSEKREGKQAIYFAESDDLENWRRLDVMSRPDPRWYNDTPTGRWDCIYPLPLADGTFEGYLTALPWTRHERPNGVAGPSVGRVVSEDGVHWSSAPPPAFDWSDVQPSSMTKLAEVATVREIGGRLHLLNVGWGTFGDRCGTYAFIGDKPEGPFVPSKAAYRLISCRRYVMTNFLRFVGGTDELLLHHTTITRTGERWFPPLKGADLDANGNLELRYWRGNDALKGRRLDLDATRMSLLAHSLAAPKFSSAGDAATLQTEGRAIAVYPATSVAAAVIEATVTVKPPFGGHGGAGFYLELAGGEGCTILAETHGQTAYFDIAANRMDVAIHPWRHGDDTIESGIATGVPHKLRLLVRDSMIEFYIDDRLNHVYSLSAGWTGRFGLVAEGAEVTWSGIAAWEMKVAPAIKHPPSKSIPGW